MRPSYSIAADLVTGIGALDHLKTSICIGVLHSSVDSEASLKAGNT